MSKRTLYSVITPLPASVTRETAIAALHNHEEMISLNPLVIKHDRCKPHPDAPPDEFHAIWYELTDRISYLPGIKGQVVYKGCFHDLPIGLQTHVYAPAGLEIKEKWSIGGNEPGEPREVMELGLVGVPRDGLYLREDVDMRCNIFLTNFVKKNLRKAHGVLVERLVVKTDLVEDRRIRASYSGRTNSMSASMRSRKSGRFAGDILVQEMPGSQMRTHELESGESWDRSPTEVGSERSASVISGRDSDLAQRRSQRRSLPNSIPEHEGQYAVANPDMPRISPGTYGTYHPYGGKSRSAGPSMAELPAEQPDYARQQREHEEQIRSYLSSPASDREMHLRADSSLGGEKLASGGVSPALSGEFYHAR